VDKENVTMTKPLRLRTLFPLWTVVVAVVCATAISGRFAGYREVFDVTVEGSGPPVILIPGLASTGEVWRGTVERLRDRYELHVLTLAGFGGPAPIGEPFLPRVAQALVEYADERRLERPVLVGHSLGGFVAWLAASEAPDAFGGIVAVDGVPYLPALADPAIDAAAMPARAEAIRVFHDKLTREQFLAQTDLALASMITAESDRDRARGWAAQTDPRAAGVAIAELMTTDLRERVRRIESPALLIGALGAAPEPMHESMRAAYRAQVAGVRGVEVVFSANSRHFVMLDAPEFLAAELEAFLERAHAPEGSAEPAGGRP
jgi:pimeloyl-ACP methyl ester carboxylesterase